MKKTIFFVLLILLISPLETSDIFVFVNHEKMPYTKKLEFPSIQKKNINYYIYSTNLKSLVKAYVNPDSSYSALSSLIRSANISIDIMIYEFWSLDILEAIESSVREKNINVRILFEGDVYGSDGDNYNRWLMNELYKISQEGYNIEIRYDTNPSYLHAKCVIIDSSIVFVSSENFVPTAYPPNPTSIEKKPYNTGSRGFCVIVYNATIARTFLNIFEDEYSNAQVYDPETGTEPQSSGFASYSAPFLDSFITDNQALIKAVFSPENSTDTIIDMINQAKYFIFIELPYINNGTTVNQLINALKGAKDRGVSVQIILEDNYPFDDDYANIVDDLRALDFYVVPAFSQTTEPLFLHNKAIIIDDEYVLVGSINWSDNSLDNNRETALLLKSRKIALFYKKVFAWDWNASSTDPFDSDKDGLSNVYEEEHGLDKADPDMDDDGFSDYTEVIILGSDPNDPNDPASASIKITSPVNYSYISSRSVTVEWSTTGSVVEYYVYLNDSYLSTLSNDTTSYTLYLQDEHWYVFTLIAKVNDKVNVSSEVVFAIDTAPPQLSLIKPYNGSTFTTNEIEIAWHAEDFSSVNFSVFVDNVLVYNGTDTSCTVNLSVGQHTIVINAVDSAGNTASLTVIVKINEPPQPPEPQEIDFRLIIMITAFVLLSLLIIIVLKRK